jgi:hypothetical protein
MAMVEVGKCSLLRKWRKVHCSGIGVDLLSLIGFEYPQWQCWCYSHHYCCWDLLWMNTLVEVEFQMRSSDSMKSLKIKLAPIYKDLTNSACFHSIHCGGHSRQNSLGGFFHLAKWHLVCGHHKCHCFCVHRRIWCNLPCTTNVLFIYVFFAVAVLFGRIGNFEGNLKLKNFEMLQKLKFTYQFPNILNEFGAGFWWYPVWILGSKI